MRKFLTAIFISTVLLFGAAMSSFGIEEELLARNVELKEGAVLSISDCIALAFKNSPKIRRQKYNIDLAKSRVGLARSQYFPVISAEVGFYNENNSNKIYYDRHYRELPSIGVAINQMVWNFGKTTSFIKMEKFYQIGAEYEFMDSLCATLFEVKARYYKVLQTKALLDIAKKRVDLYETSAKIAKNTADAGIAKVNLTHSKLLLVEAENNYRNALVDLSNAMYIERLPKEKAEKLFTLKNTSTFNLADHFTDMKLDKSMDKIFTPEIFDFPIDKAVDIAYENSPDLKVLIATKHAMEQSLNYYKRIYYPELNAGVSYGFNNTDIYSTNNSLKVGVNLSSRANIMEIYHGIKGARAELNAADNEINLFKKDLAFEVSRAFNNVDKNQRQIPVAMTFLNQAAETLTLVERQYRSGRSDIDFIAYKDAVTDYSNSLTEYVNNLYNYNMALIQVEMAMHYHIVDIHHKSEHAVHYHQDDLIKHLIEALNCDEKEEPKSSKRAKHTKKTKK